MECLSTHIADAIFPGCYLIFLIYWNYYTYFRHVGHATFLHFFIGIMFLMKFSYISLLINCYIQQAVSWFSPIQFTIKVLIFAFDGATVLSCFSFISLGLGLRDIMITRDETKIVIYLLIPTYILRGGFYFFQGLVSTIYPFFLVFAYFYLVDTITSTQAKITDEQTVIEYKKIQFLNTIRSIIFACIGLYSIQYCVNAILLYFYQESFWVEIGFRAAEMALLGIFTIFLRPNEDSLFTNGLIISGRSFPFTPKFLTANLNNSYQNRSDFYSIATLPNSALNLASPIENT